MSDQAANEPFVVQWQDDVQDRGPAPHGGTGTALYHAFFRGINTTLGVNRIHIAPGASVGEHLQPVDEIFYVVAGKGLMRVDEHEFEVAAGAAVLTRGGHVHSLRQTGAAPLELIVFHAGRTPSP